MWSGFSARRTQECDGDYALGIAISFFAPYCSIALSHYDRHVPLFDGSVTADKVDLQVLEVGQSDPLKHGQNRHERMLQKGEFDICELSLSYYLVAAARIKI